MARGPTVGVTTRSSGTLSQGKARFSAQVANFGIKAKRDVEKVFRLATFRLVTVMQTTTHEGGRLPYKDGYLRASLTITINSPPPPSDRVKATSSTVYNPAAILQNINKAKIGDKIIASYTMIYARRLEFGFSGTDSLGRSYNQPPRGFVRLTAQRWKSIVEEVANEVLASKKGGSGK